MKYLKSFLAVLLLCSLWNLRAKAQDKVYMPFFETINMNHEYQYSVSKLFKSYLEDENRFSLILPSKSDSLYYSEPFETTKAKAASYGAKYFIIGELNRIGEMVMVSVALYNTADGTKVWNDKLKAKNPDDLDPIMQRIAKNIGTPNKAANDGDIYSVTEYETRELKKTTTSDYFGLAIGGVVLFTSIPAKPLTGADLLWVYDAKNILMEINAQGYWASHISLYDLSLETYYPFKHSSNTPFIGGGLGISDINDNNYYSFTNTSDHQGYGLMVLAGGGYIFNRTSSTELRLSGNAFVCAYTVNSENPFGAMLKIEFLFHR